MTSILTLMKNNEIQKHQTGATCTQNVFHHAFQNVYKIPIEGHDQKLDWILTESYLYKAI